MSNRFHVRITHVKKSRKKQMTYMTQKITQLEETNSKNQKKTKEILEQIQKSNRAKVCTNPIFRNKFKKPNKHQRNSGTNPEVEQS